MEFLCPYSYRDVLTTLLIWSTTVETTVFEVIFLVLVRLLLCQKKIWTSLHTFLMSTTVFFESDKQTLKCFARNQVVTLTLLLSFCVLLLFTLCFFVPTLRNTCYSGHESRHFYFFRLIFKGMTKPLVNRLSSLLKSSYLYRGRTNKNKNKKSNDTN